MINKKLLTLLCGAWLMGAVAMAASPAVIEDAPKAVYTHDDGSVLTIQYPSVTVEGNAAAAAVIANYFADEQAQAQEFFAQQGTKGVKLTEEKHYTVTLNNGKYLSFLDEGYLYFRPGRSSDELEDGCRLRHGNGSAHYGLARTGQTGR